MVLFGAQDRRHYGHNVRRLRQQEHVRVLPRRRLAEAPQGARRP